MLVLSREKKEGIVIGEKGDILIYIADVKDGVVKLAIKAPKSVPIYREEIYQSTISNNKLAATKNGKILLPQQAVRATNIMSGKFKSNQ